MWYLKDSHHLSSFSITNFNWNKNITVIDPVYAAQYTLQEMDHKILFIPLFQTQPIVCTMVDVSGGKTLVERPSRQPHLGQSFWRLICSLQPKDFLRAVFNLHVILPIPGSQEGLKCLFKTKSYGWESKAGRGSQRLAVELAAWIRPTRFPGTWGGLSLHHIHEEKEEDKKKEKKKMADECPCESQFLRVTFWPAEAMRRTILYTSTAFGVSSLLNTLLPGSIFSLDWSVENSPFYNKDGVRSGGWWTGKYGK